MDVDFLKQVQRSGWQVVSIVDDKVIARCPAEGCGVKMALTPESGVPTCDAKRERSRLNHVVGSYEDAKNVLRARREDLCWSIHETEEVAGITIDLIAKCEKDEHTKMPNTETFILWANALGYEVVLRPTEMTARALRQITEVTDRAEARRKRFRLAADRRERR